VPHRIPLLPRLETSGSGGQVGRFSHSRKTSS
jgi:hypothetical protein